MGFIGNYINMPQEDDNIETLYENKIKNAYFFIANIHTELLVDFLENMSMLIVFYVYESETIRQENPLLTLEELQIRVPLENKSVNVGKLWDYCYINSKEEIENLMKFRLVQNEETDDLPNGYIVELEDI